MSNHPCGWSDRSDADCVGGFPVPGLPSAPRVRACRVSLTMIVRDEETTLPCCLESAKGMFDEVIVVDTGSTDLTRDIARSFEARSFDFAWCDDFAAARNAAMTHATGDYVFWLDADEVIELVERETLRRFLDGLRPGAGIAYTLRVRGAMIPEPGFYQVRLFPARPDIRWMGTIHEVIWPAIRRAGLTVWPTGVSVHHRGYADPLVRAEAMAQREDRSGPIGRASGRSLRLVAHGEDRGQPRPMDQGAGVVPPVYRELAIGSVRRRPASPSRPGGMGTRKSPGRVASLLRVAGPGSAPCPRVVRQRSDARLSRRGSRGRAMLEARLDARVREPRTNGGL